MSKFLFIIAQEGFRDEELKNPKQVLENAGIECEVASITTDTAFGKMGMQIVPNLSVKDANPNNYDGVCIVGGPGAPELANYPEVLNLLRKFNDQEKIVSAICSGPTVLAKAGLLKDKKLTAFKADDYSEIILASGGILQDADVFSDSNIITGNGPESAFEFGKALRNKLLNT